VLMLRLKYRRRILMSSGAKETPHEKNRPVRGGFLSAGRTSFKLKYVKWLIFLTGRKFCFDILGTTG